MGSKLRLPLSKETPVNPTPQGFFAPLSSVNTHLPLLLFNTASASVEYRLDVQRVDEAGEGLLGNKQWDSAFVEL